MGERIPARSVAVLGPASSTRSELTGISLALENCPITENLTILTDSLDSLTSLFNLRRADFPQTLFSHPSRHLLVHLVSLLNNRHAAGALPRWVTVKAHSGDPSTRRLMHLRLHQRSMMTTDGQGGSILTLMLYTFTWQVTTRQ